MKIFIAGARSVTELPASVQSRMFNIYKNGFEVLVGDCYGVDASVQRFFAALNYTGVSIYASNGVARNNIGNWRVETVKVKSGTRGFDFYAQKDIAMAQAADYGLMIWDGKSRGTLNNMVQLANQHKAVLVSLPSADKLITIHNENDLRGMISLYAPRAERLYRQLTQNTTGTVQQMSFV